MKTIEQKAKAYDEIIERAKTMLSAGEVMYGKENNASQLITDIIPELKESEDEKMIRFITNELACLRASEDKGSCRYNELTSALSWLEKQKEPDNTSASTIIPSCWECEHKEQKPDDPSDDELQRHQDELYDFKIFAAKQAREHHISFVHDFEWNNFCAEILSYFNEKQKPAWSEEDESILNNIIAYRYLNVDDLEWIKKLPKRFSLQPKQEWSEEDETKLNDVIHIIEKHCGLVKSIRNHYVKFLKSLLE